MNISLKESMASDTELFLNTDEFGETVSYNDVDIDVVFVTGEDRDSNDFSVSGQAAIADVYVSKSDVASWTRKDKIVRDGETWRFRRCVEDDPGMWHLEFVGRETVL